MKIPDREIKNSINFIYKIVRGFLSNREDAEELTQMVLLKIISNRDKFDGKFKLQTWIYRIALNTVIDHLRRPAINEKSITWYDNKAEDQVLKNDIKNALQRLPEERREIMVLYFFLGYKLNEIASTLDLSMGTVNSRFARAKQDLKTYLSTRGYDYE